MWFPRHLATYGHGLIVKVYFPENNQFAIIEKNKIAKITATGLRLGEEFWAWNNY